MKLEELAGFSQSIEVSFKVSLCDFLGFNKIVSKFEFWME